MPLRIIYYDTETTGLHPDKERIIELAAYDPLNDRSFVSLINPGRLIPAEATAIHHITNEMVAEAPNFESVADDFCAFCEGDVVLLAHNNDAFDIHFMRAEFTRANRKMPDWKFLDSLKWARRYRPDLPRHTLQFLREIYGINANNAHRALDDVMILHQVFKEMTDDLSIDTIYELMNVPVEIHHMPFGKYQGTLLKDVPKDYIAWMNSSGAFAKPENLELKKAFDKLLVLETSLKS